MLTMMPYAVERPFGQLGSAVPSKLPVHPQPPPFWSEVRSRKGLDDAPALLSTDENSPVLLTLFSGQIQDIFPH